MAFNLEVVWENPIHREFIESLDAGRATALYRLLVLASRVDFAVSTLERTELLQQLAELSPFARVAAERDDDDEPEVSLREIARDLEDDTTRRHAFRTTVQFLKHDGFVPAEADFVRLMGTAFGIEDEVVDFAIDARQ